MTPTPRLGLGSNAGILPAGRWERATAVLTVIKILFLCLGISKVFVSTLAPLAARLHRLVLFSALRPSVTPTAAPPLQTFPLTVAYPVGQGGGLC